MNTSVPTTTPENNLSIKGLQRDLMIWRILFLTVTLSAIILFGSAKSRAKAQIENLNSQIEILATQSQENQSQGETDLENIHSIALEQGYQSAIWDVYFQTPSYLIQEDEHGVSLWKKQNIDPVNAQRLQKFKEEQSHE